MRIETKSRVKNNTRGIFKLESDIGLEMVGVVFSFTDISVPPPNLNDKASGQDVGVKASRIRVSLIKHKKQE